MGEAGVCPLMYLGWSTGSTVERKQICAELLVTIFQSRVMVMKVTLSLFEQSGLLFIFSMLYTQ